ncbi:hypothetical protein [Rhizobium ruizarguesonis]|uniref:hypothetical protein n=1 Tax=Rhizobium ruizarguesonis TaxID=2081791 RepID=UPI0013EF50BF|nr:hypothetical protein [Rhizobium ruizarguesonis]
MADLRKAADLEEQVLQAVRRRTPIGTTHRIDSVQQKFLDGILYTVGFDVPDAAGGPPISYSNRVYVTRSSVEVYGHDEFLFQIVGARHSRSFYDIFANGDVVSGVIALVVTILIVPSFIASYYTGSQIAVPEWITSGWLLILGFYFGKASGRSN